jgi:5-methylcytosine-specific restriction protein A
LTYKGIHDDLGLDLHGPTYGLSLLNHGLTELVTMLRNNNLPAISSLVVNQDSHLPGDDFFRFHERRTDDYDWWLNQAAASVQYNWDNVVLMHTERMLTEVTFPDEVIETNILIEGVVRQVVVNIFERSEEGRRLCLLHYGYRCSVCNFDFEARYGEIGRKFIHVHHLIPLSQVTREYHLDPIEHLRPVCPNCHAMLHRKDPPFTLEQLREILN